jgi:hypothetical protein
MLAALALGQQLLDELEQILQRIPSDRAHLLSDGDLTLCERKSFRFCGDPTVDIDNYFTMSLRFSPA